MRKQVKDYFTNLLSGNVPQVISKIILFGSEAYGTPRVKSDIDIAIVTDTFLRQSERVEVYEFFDSITPPKEVQIVFVANGEYRRGFDVRRDILGKGVCVYERLHI